MPNHFRTLAAALVLSLFAAEVSRGADDDLPAPEKTIGLTIENFTLKDSAGQSHSLTDAKNAKAHVLLFLGTECPLAKLYMPEVNALHKEYAPQGVAFLGINSNMQDSIFDVVKHAKLHELPYPVVKDVRNKIADRLAARRTPEVFVLNAKREIVYRGRIDDQYSVGVISENRTERNLKDALDAVLAGKPIAKAVTEAPGCLIGRMNEPDENSDITYANQISRLLQKRCVECHREGEIGPFALTDYEEIAGWAETLAEVVEDGLMPPWHAADTKHDFANERSMTEDEKQMLYKWVEAGAPFGDEKDLPEPRTFTTGWQLPKEPDLVIPMRDEPVNVPAEGTVRYQYFSVDPGLTEDKWVSAMEVIPGNRRVVHHVLVLVRDKTGRIGSPLRDDFLCAYVPGLRTMPASEGMAKRIPAGAQLIFQVHYTPIGTPEKDLSKLGLVFADPDTITHQVVTTKAANPRLRIPPGDANHKVEARSRSANQDVLLLGMSPHMHLRGKSFKYEAVYPDGSTEVLLDVPAYDFNWQTEYRLKEPLTLPRGTRMYCVAHFDNSEENPFNPDPTQTVRWGDQTWEEMMIGYFHIAIPIDDANQTLAEAEKAETDEATRRAEQFIADLDADGDGKLLKKEVPERMLPIFNQVDANKDDEVTVEELANGIRRYVRRRNR